MWEAIEANKRRSRVLIFVMGALLLALGWLLGAVLFAGLPQLPMFVQPERALQHGGPAVADPAESPSWLLNSGGLIGIGVAVVVWVGLTLAALTGGEGIALRSAGAREIQKNDAPQLWNVVEEMTIASGLGSMPRVCVIDDDAPNAFAVGRRKETAAVAVTTGLLRRFSRDELQGVVAHEIAHVHNQDVRFMTLAFVMVGSIAVMSDVFLRSLWLGAGRRSSSRRGGGGAQIVLLVVAILFAILAPLMARMLYFSCSRKREYLADACAARFTRYPEGLASALEKIGRHAASAKEVNRGLAPMYIVNPAQGMAAAGVFATHPPLNQRVRILRGMAGGAGYAEYEAAYRKVTGGSCLSERVVGESGRVAVRPPVAEARQDAVQRGRDAVDLIDRAANFLLVPCVCGVRMKLPPSFEHDSVKCPRCGRTQEMSKAAFTRAGPDDPEPELTYRRKGQGWESFKCACGYPLQLSPAFRGDSVECRKCGRTTRVLG